MILMTEIIGCEKIAYENFFKMLKYYIGKNIFEVRGCLISIIKTLYIRKQKRMAEGRKCTAVDEHYFKLAENQLHSELTFNYKRNKY